jgi:putative membrane protein insertion efficiency factor
MSEPAELTTEPAGAEPKVNPHGRAISRSTAKHALYVLVTAPIVVYQRVVSPVIPQRCKYHPTCSRYAVEAIREYGILRGAVLAGWRLLRCNPWSYGGYDPVQAQRVFTVGHRTGA